jgi:aarF domain-containing kinase
LVKL